MSQNAYNRFESGDASRIRELAPLPLAAFVLTVLVIAAVGILCEHWVAAVIAGAGMVLLSTIGLIDKRRMALRYRSGIREISSAWIKALTAESGDLQLNKRLQRDKEFAVLIAAISNSLNSTSTQAMPPLQSSSFSDITEVAAGLAHEIGTPLNVVRVNAQYLARNFEQDSREKRHLDKIVQQTDRIADLIRELLEVAGEEFVSRGEFDFQPLLHACLRRIEEAYPELEWVKEIEEGDMPIHGSARRMNSAIMNVLQNACQEMNGHGVLGIRLHRLRYRGSEHLRLLIADTGGGISNEISNKIFQPFFTTKSSGEGTGLGLALVNRVIRQHHGTIHVHSSSGQGAVFEILLPCAPTELSETVEEQHAG